MLVFDQLKKDDPQLRVVALVVLSGLAALLAGLWWVQVVSVRDYEANLETQSFRTVRIPAVRGKILDRDGRVLAENRPTYNISIYLDELRETFKSAGSNELFLARIERRNELARELGRPLTDKDRRHAAVTLQEKNLLARQARWQVASNVVTQVGQLLRQPLTLNQTNFERHYERRLALPFPVASNLDPTNIARFEEQSTGLRGVDLEVQSTRVYPNGTTAAHLIGHLQRDDSSAEGEEAFFSYRLPDYRGIVGIEAGYDKQLRGVAGAKSVQVNNMGYRTTENIWSPAEPGQNVVLTIDLDIQQAAEQALPVFGPATRGAVVVMNVTNGDVLAMASSPTLDPNWFIRGCTHEEWQRISSLHAEKNRATQENYAPASVFKTVVAMAALEAGLDPNKEVDVPPNPNNPAYGCYMLHNHPIRDTAPPGRYNLRRAIMRSCNSYFITQGIQFLGPEPIVRMGQRLHFGERMGLGTSQETKGSFPSVDQVRSGWTEGNTANMSIGQDPVLVTPLQIAVLVSAIGNGGKVLYPRLVERIEPQDPLFGQGRVVFEGGRVRDELGVSKRTLALLHDAMLGETEDKTEGTGWRAAVPGIRICGKTGTAEIQDVHNKKIGQTTWFASFAPYEAPRYAVVVMVEDGISGGKTCAPIAGKVYTAIQERERKDTAKTVTVARMER